MHPSRLEGRRVAVWGWGREGRATAAWLRRRFPAQPLAVFCAAAEVAQVAALGDPLLSARAEVDPQALADFDVVVKSPGISPYAPPAGEATLLGARFVGASALWFATHPDARTVCVTGTKGKSTTTALVAHLLRAAGQRTALAGNIGLPLIELMDVTPALAFWAIELSSYQTRDAFLDHATRPEVGVVLNLFPEHLDWHGGEARYVEDKLALVTRGRPRTLVLNAADARLAALDPEATAEAHLVWFNRADGWHVGDGHVCRGGRPVFDLRRLHAPGQHNGGNLCAALAAVEALGLDAVALAAAAESFRPLPHRLQPLGAVAGVEYVDDSISTTPHASLAALDCFRGRRVAILVGGHDRGLDWGHFAERIAREPPVAVVAMGANGPRIHAALAPHAHGGRFRLLQAADMAAAVQAAAAVLDHTGVVLLSPGAPSFDAYRDYAERGRHFAAIAGFDTADVGAIGGLGVA
ncbi:UDP-N-acetylmuramoyl-L-alanine--D-glutamate ligase [Coralloluteibacterium stylophorae]|uniref:UDP-N-acetylmuramoyl-L-alanine--L-glutamate ligase n=1 Tax=Coralloluteibacterium stylophorae TaxID=1776034 RepID=A0A8J8AWV6_9GAMM|nr:UDP-N-acetylmuramoyl-L-alanine--D-glutamate ligase [Coralloluteibacterium stylophorae]